MVLLAWVRLRRLGRSGGGVALVILPVVYLVLAGLLLRARRVLGPLLRDGLRTPYHQLTDGRP